MIQQLIHKHKWPLTGIVLGAIAGYLYYFFVGCSTGNCMIASNPFVAVPYFAFLGYLFTGIFKKKDETR
jgi:xanthine/uracil permease